MSRLFNNGNIISNNQNDKLMFKLGDKINIDGQEGIIIDIKFGQLTSSPIYKIELSFGKVIYRYQEEMRESRTIKNLNNRIDKLFEEDSEDLEIIKDIKNAINDYENSNDFRLKSRLASKLRSLSTKLRDYQRNNMSKDNESMINKLINYIESKSDLKFEVENVDNKYKIYRTIQKGINNSLSTGEKENPCFSIINDSRISSKIHIFDYIDNRNRSKFSYMPFIINDTLTDDIPNDISDSYIKIIGNRIIQVYNDNKDNVINEEGV